jgi:GMP synthase (glutamine-hydrolysing)
MRPVLILKTGTAVDSVRAEFGDFEDWFAAEIKVDSSVEVLDCRTEPLPADSNLFSAIIVTGSASMVSHREPWSEHAGTWLASAVHDGVPVLAVCYGHQLLAQALNGVAGTNPVGRHIGTRCIRLTAAAENDRLFAGLPRQFPAQVSHLESVLELPAGAVRLAEIDTDRNYAYRIADNAWGVQFHPEFSAAATRGYIRARSEAIIAEGLDVEQLYDGVEDTPLAHSLISRFVRLAKEEVAGRAA